MANPQKLPRRSAQSDVDAVLAYYHRARREPAEVLIDVRLAHEVLARFAQHLGGDRYHHRGFTLRRREP